MPSITENDDMDTSSRGFLPGYSVNYRGIQRAVDRFGSDYQDEIEDMLSRRDEEPYPPGFTGRWDDFPRIARMRMNLTALSQYYDLYFVAYRGFIHIYRLSRGVKVAVADPELILDPKHHETPMSEFCSGQINPYCPHEINHMLVGTVGEKEVLLVSKDNGDVVAWYTDKIARYIEVRIAARQAARRKRSGCHDHRSEHSVRLPYPTHFFADNVGKSAWGLAMHQKSRLIAVSSNTHEITVFAFALAEREKEAVGRTLSGDEKGTGGNEDVVSCPQSDSERRPSCKATPTDLAEMKADDDGQIMVEMDIPVTLDKSTAKAMRGMRPSDWAGRPMPSKDHNAADDLTKLQNRFHTRERTWRIVLTLGISATNLPSIAFCEDADGNADRVTAIDINGYLYIADIWQIGRKPIRISPHNVQYPDGRRYARVTGWNVLPVMDSHLLPTDSLHAAIGVHPSKAVYRAKFCRSKTSRGAWIDISKTMAEIRYDAARRKHEARIAFFVAEDLSRESDGIPPDEVFVTTPHLSDKIWPPIWPPLPDKNDGMDFDTGPVRLAMTMVPHSGNCFTEFPGPRDWVEFAGARGAARRAHRVPMALTLHQFREHKAQLWGAESLMRDVSFVRFNEEDIEVLTLDADDCGVVCHHVLDDVDLHDQTLSWDMPFGRRCSMLLRIPELNLVVLGSMCGRVALITLTKPPQSNGPRRAFRVDAVLPFDEEDGAAERPYTCLLGIAVSPAPEPRSRGLELRRRRDSNRRASRVVEAAPPSRWRLILNYQDHSILQYDISRRPDGEPGSWDDFAGPRDSPQSIHFKAVACGVADDASDENASDSGRQDHTI